MKKAVATLFLSLSLVSFISAQDYNSIRYTVVYGGHIDFNFTSIKDYQTGIQITNGTVLGIGMADIATEGVTVGSTIDGWELYISSTAANIGGDGGNTLPLNTIQAQATNSTGLAGATYDGLKYLVNGACCPPTGNRLMRSLTVPADAINHQVLISYECGMVLGVNDLLGSPADFYTVDIELWIWPICGGANCPP